MKLVWFVSKFCVLSEYIYIYIAHHKIKQCKHKKYSMYKKYDPAEFN